jgi:hypothetical protein
VQAAKEISVRAVARFLEEKNGVKISYVTIGRALRNSAKYWDLYYDPRERHFWNVAEAHKKRVLDFISDPEQFQEMLEEKPVFEAANEEEALDAAMEYEYSVKELDENWFCFDEAILEEARFHLIKRLHEKPKSKNEDLDDEQG